MTTPILEIEEIASNQADKEGTANDAFNALENALCNFASVSLSSGNVSMTSGANLLAFRRNAVIKATGNTVSRTLTLPAVKRLLVVWNSGSATLTVAVGSTSTTIAAGSKALVYADGTTNGLEVIASASATTQPYDIPVWIAGKPTSSERLLRLVFTRAVTLPASLTDSAGSARLAATAQTDFDLRKNGTSFGTVRFAASGTTASFIAASSTSFAAGDRLDVIAPATPDATLEDISFTLAGTR